jgi:chaperone modulatory protein CbpM
MIRLEEVAGRFPGLAPQELTLWIERRWLRAEPAPGGGWLLTEVDIARARLLVELRVTLEVDEEAMPLVLSLLDQLYDARRTLRGLVAAIEEQPEEVRRGILAAAARHAQGRGGGGGG